MGEVNLKKDQEKVKGKGSGKTHPQKEVVGKESPESQLPEFPEDNGKSVADLSGEQETTERDSLDLEEVCGNLWVVLFQLWGIFQKGIEPLKESEKKIYAPPTARLAVKYHIQDMMKDEFFLIGAVGVGISKRIITQKKSVQKEGKNFEAEKQVRPYEGNK